MKVNNRDRVSELLVFTCMALHLDFEFDPNFCQAYVFLWCGWRRKLS